jgi:sugar-specific transcriptional regulator TrmB
MDINTLVNIGLNKTQATAYIFLVKNGSCTPPALAKSISETRTNAYAVLDQLTELGLAKKTEEYKKFIYYAGNPASIEKLARKRRQDAFNNERTVQAAMPALLNYFYTFSEQPGVKFYQGVDGIKEIYNDTLRVCKDIYLIRSIHDQDLLTLDFYEKYKTKRAKLGIKTHIINPSRDKNAWNIQNDLKYNLERTQVPTEMYSSPVEISTYGNKVAVISFGKEAIGTVIESPQIAESLKQIFHLAQLGANSLNNEPGNWEKS